MVIVYVIDKHLLFVGNDKFENDGLIKYSQRYMKELETQVYWFHVDDLSSPHAYVRLNEGETEIPPNLVQYCAQIVKNGSIEGVKRPAVDVIYTSCSNLTKNKGMKVGQVSFVAHGEIIHVRGVRKNNQMLKTLEKVKEIKELVDMEKELDDLIHNFKKKGKKKDKRAKDPWDEMCDDEEAKPEPPSSQQKSMLEGMTQAEFSTNLEDDFM